MGAKLGSSSVLWGLGFCFAVCFVLAGSIWGLLFCFGGGVFIVLICYLSREVGHFYSTSTGSPILLEQSTQISRKLTWPCLEWEVLMGYFSIKLLMITRTHSQEIADKNKSIQEINLHPKSLQILVYKSSSPLFWNKSVILTFGNNDTRKVFSSCHDKILN